MREEKSMKKAAWFVKTLALGLSERRKVGQEAKVKARAQARMAASPTSESIAGALAADKALLAWAGLFVASTALAVGLGVAAASPSVHWTPQSWSDSAQAISWGEIPENPPPQMRVARCVNGVFAEGAPSCAGQGVILGQARGWRERAQNAQRGVFEPGDSAQTKRDLLATKTTDRASPFLDEGGSKSGKGAYLLACAFIAWIANVVAWTLAAGARELKAWATHKAEPSIPTLTGVCVCGSLAIMILVGWGAEAWLRVRAPEVDTPGVRTRYDGGHFLLDMRRRSPMALVDRKAEGVSEKDGETKTLLRSHDARTVAWNAKKGETSLGSWSMEELEAGDQGELLEKRAPWLSESQKAQALWLLAKHKAEEPVWLDREISGMGIAFLLALASGVAVLGAAALKSLKAQGARLASHAQKIAREGERVALAQQEREDLVAEADLTMKKKSAMTATADAAPRGAKRL
jgi:hypothetical protein